MALLSRAVRNAAAMIRSQEWGDSSIPPNSASAASLRSPGSSAGEQGALAIGAVMACVKALYDDATVLPFKAYRGDRNGPHSPIEHQPSILTEPFGPDLEPQDGVGQIVVSRAMRGNGYCYVVRRDGNGFPAQLLILHPDAVRPRRDVETRQLYYQVGFGRYGSERFDPSDIVHIRGMMLPGSDEGVDMLTYERITFDLAWNVNSYADSFFNSGGSPAGVISVPGPGDRKKAREVKEMWESGHAGTVNAHRPAVMFGGSTWTQLTVTPENAQFLETRRYLREEVCGLFGVPLQRIQAIVDNASQGGGKGLDAIDAGYVKHGLMPTMGPIERAWTRMIPGQARTWAAFDYDEFLRANAETRAAIAQQHRTSAVRTIDEIRAEYGWPPLPDGVGTDPFTPLNSNSSPTGGADNTPKPGSTEGGAA